MKTAIETATLIIASVAMIAGLSLPWILALVFGTTK